VSKLTALGSKEAEMKIIGCDAICRVDDKVARGHALLGEDVMLPAMEAKPRHELVGVLVQTL